MMKLLPWKLSSLRAKLLLMFVILTSIPLIAVGLISYQKSFNAVSAHSKAATMLDAEQLARNIDILFEDSSKLLELENNPQVLQFLFSQSDTYEDAKAILKAFALYRETNKYDSVLNITMVNLYGRGISERRGVFQLSINPLRNPHLQHLFNNPDEILNIPSSDASSLDRLDGFQYPQHNIISIMATVKQRITHEVIGFIIIDLNDYIVEQFVNEVTLGETGFMLVLDQQGQPIFTPSRAVDYAQKLQSVSLEPVLRGTQSHYVAATEGKPQFVVYSTSDTTGWKIVGLAPLQEIVAEANDIRKLIIICVLLSIVFAITLHFFTTTRLTRPIQLLKNKMRQAAGGYLEVKVKPSGDDEIADLGRSFNIMLEKIKMLLQQSIKEHEHLQKAELRALQAQINPHFLYNTLDSIVWMAEAGKNKGVIQLVKALSRFFRISLNKGRDWITLKEELEHVRSYLIIQQMRYRDILDYDIDVPDSLQSLPILKMTLQPIVENAIYHGIKNKRGMGRISITASTILEQELHISIADDGIGMKKEKLEQLREALLQPPMSETEDGSSTASASYGLLNVQQRIRLYYGDHFLVRVESVEKEGTIVTVRIPMKPGVAHIEKSAAG